MTLPIVENPGDTLSPVCAMLRTKTAFGSYVTDFDDSEWHDGTSSTAVYWCLKTMDMAGPDDGFVHPESCRANRACYRSDD